MNWDVRMMARDHWKARSFLTYLSFELQLWCRHLFLLAKQDQFVDAVFLDIGETESVR